MIRENMTGVALPFGTHDLDPKSSSWAHIPGGYDATSGGASGCCGRQRGMTKVRYARNMASAATIPRTGPPSYADVGAT